MRRWSFWHALIAVAAAAVLVGIYAAVVVAVAPAAPVLAWEATDSVLLGMLRLLLPNMG
jgi:hypothetical protein